MTVGKTSSIRIDMVSKISFQAIDLILSCSIFFQRFLVEMMPFIDVERIAVWGKGQGGHLALRVMAEDLYNPITCGMAISPISKRDIYGEWKIIYFN